MSDPQESWVSDEERGHFDGVLEKVIAELPARIRALLEEVPLVVEDYPSDELLKSIEAEDPAELCGLHDGIALTERSVDQSGQLPDTIYLFRLGVLEESADDQGEVHEDELKRQIRITLLHEIGHHFGLSEQDLEKLGYG